MSNIFMLNNFCQIIFVKYFVRKIIFTVFDPISEHALISGHPLFFVLKKIYFFLLFIIIIFF